MLNNYPKNIWKAEEDINEVKKTTYMKKVENINKVENLKKS